MVKEEKLKAVEDLVKAMNSYHTVGFIDLSKMPTKQFQQIRKGLNEKAAIKISKKSIVQFALKKLEKPEMRELEKFVPTQPGIILTNLGTFQIYKEAGKLKSSTYAKENDVVNMEIEVKPGPTDLLPGPVISEFAKVGLIAGVEGGKIAVKKGKIVARAGDKISKDLAGILRKLKIEPIEISLNIAALYEDGKIYMKDILSLVGKYPDMIKDAFNKALSLSVGIAYPTKENIKYLFAKAYQQSKALESKIGGK